MTKLRRVQELKNSSKTDAKTQEIEEELPTFEDSILLAYRSKNYHRCIKLIDRILKFSQPETSVHYRILLAASYTMLGTPNLKKSHRILDGVLKLQPANAYALYGKGVAFFFGGRFADSLRLLDLAIAADATCMERAERLRLQVETEMRRVEVEIEKLDEDFDANIECFVVSKKTTEGNEEAEKDAEKAENNELKDDERKGEEIERNVLESESQENRLETDNKNTAVSNGNSQKEEEGEKEEANLNSQSREESKKLENSSSKAVEATFKRKLSKKRQKFRKKSQSKQKHTRSDQKNESTIFDSFLDPNQAPASKHEKNQDTPDNQDYPEYSQNPTNNSLKPTISSSSTISNVSTSNSVAQQHFTKGLDLYMSGDLGKSLRHFAKALKLEPDFDEADEMSSKAQELLELTEVADMNMNERNYAAVAEILGQALEIDESNDRVNRKFLFQRGLALFELGRNEESVRDYEEYARLSKKLGLEVQKAPH